MKRLTVFTIFITLVIVGFYLYYKEGSMPVNKTDQASKDFAIEKGESLSSIAKKLENEGLIRNKLVFYFIVKQLKIEKNIQAGDFQLSASMDANQIAKSLTHGTFDINVTIIEGLRKEETAQIISKKFDISETEFTVIAKEGYLFPDTYSAPKDASAESIIKIFTDNFTKKYDQALKNRVSQNGLTDEEVIILASLVEKEEKSDPDRQKVASILLKRYKKDWPLQVDATIQYALGYQVQEKSWWKKYLTIEDKEIDSPYNTYKNKGLPPSPITSPGLASIQAVVNANENIPYWYYLSDKNGKTHYAVTLEEHEANIAKYLH